MGIKSRIWARLGAAGPARWIFAILGAVMLVWFALPVSVGTLNVGNLIGAPLSACVLAVSIFWPWAKRLWKSVWRFWPGKILLSLLTGIAVFSAVTGTVLGILMLQAAWNPPPKDELQEPLPAIVLGCRIYGTKPSPMLQRRLDAAVTYLMDNPDAPCVVTGGQGPDEDIAEAEVMLYYLEQHGISTERIIMEDRAEDTEQNIQYSQALLRQRGLGERVVIISDGFHQLRAKLWAKEQGMEVYAISSRTPLSLLPTFCLREMFGILGQRMAN